MKLAALMRAIIACRPTTFRAVDISAVDKTVVLVSDADPILATREAKQICARLKFLFRGFVELDYGPTRTGSTLIAIMF